MKKLNLFTFMILGVALLSCDPDNSDPKKTYGKWFPDVPQNITELNTAYDDFNSDLEIVGKGFDLYYSTNKNSEGQNFDIASGHFAAFINPESDSLEFQVIPNFAFWSSAIFPIINSSYNELGPFSYEWEKDKYDTHGNWLFMCADDSHLNFDIKFINIDITQWSQGSPYQIVYGPLYAKVLNSASNDYYPTVNRNHSQVYFCSDRDGTYDIFSVNISGSNILDWLENGTDKANVCSTISSTSDDKCPYIDGDLMVFTSNREHGFGGFDLWYSVFENNQWSEPINFGPEINTKYDEYRPAIEYFEASTNDLMIFSSNRPGGHGGFDLYYTGIPKLINK